MLFRHCLNIRSNNAELKPIFFSAELIIRSCKQFYRKKRTQTFLSGRVAGYFDIWWEIKKYWIFENVLIDSRYDTR